jgi:hypothetical protein
MVDHILILSTVHCVQHRVESVDRVPGFLSSRPNWIPRPLTRKRVLLPLWFQGGDTLRAGGANSDEGTDILVLQYDYSGIIRLRCTAFMCIVAERVVCE